MAKKEIHICDMCKSYSDKSVRITFDIGYGDGLSGKVIAALNKNRRREVCYTCLDRLVEEFNLDVEDCSARLFEDFELPQKEVFPGLFASDNPP